MVKPWEKDMHMRLQLDVIVQLCVAGYDIVCFRFRHCLLQVFMITYWIMSGDDI
jgi:hypothetical protein